MRYDLAGDRGLAYRLMAATIIPRPIAWIVTRSGSGRLNAAPFSFFNAMGAEPPTVAVGLLSDPQRGYKDTARNIRDTGEFVINLVPEWLVAEMNLTSVDAPADVDELALAGLETSPSAHIGPPRIAASPVSFECITHTIIETGPKQIVVVGRVLAVHVEDRFLRDPERGHVDTAALDLVGRQTGAAYVRTRDVFELERPTWAEHASDAGR